MECELPLCCNCARSAWACREGVAGTSWLFSNIDDKQQLPPIFITEMVEVVNDLFLKPYLITKGLFASENTAGLIRRFENLSETWVKFQADISDDDKIEACKFLHFLMKKSNPVWGYYYGIEHFKSVSDLLNSTQASLRKELRKSEESNQINAITKICTKNPNTKSFCYTVRVILFNAKRAREKPIKREEGYTMYID